MPIRFSPVLAPKLWERGADFSAKSINLHERGELASPIFRLDDFRVRGEPFGPHPHAGFSALTFVFEDTEARARSRDSLGNDVEVGPGGILWFQAARGAMHHEIPAGGHELHGAQIFVKLSARNKLIAPRTLWLDGSAVPEWQAKDGDRVRIVVGSFGNVSSPLMPAEPLDLLDVTLRSVISFELKDGHHALFYVCEGGMRVHGDGGAAAVEAGHAVSLSGTGECVTLEGSARLLILSGAELNEPVVAEGPFIMNNHAQIAAAAARFRAGEMGHLAPIQARDDGDRSET
jgi:redox-sensitive bicupin YhaK (pirin superfamily)